MSALLRLKSAATLAEFSDLLGYAPAKLAYVVFKMPPLRKYNTFEIRKSSGGVRLIRAPSPELALLQRRLANILVECLNEIENTELEKRIRPVNHAFSTGRSIITNAREHAGRRHIINIDIEDFFPSINFGRVRGYFMKDRYFELSPKIATLIAQIACVENELPQGSPCSPVISNLIGRILDKRLVRLAKINGMRYSRYADDLTFSTNGKAIPSDIANRTFGTSDRWILGHRLNSKILSAGFRVNAAKTRIQYHPSRQLVTGLVVNSKVNVSQEYYRSVRSMSHLFFRTGKYFVLEPAVLHGGKAGDPLVKIELDNASRLLGMMEFVHAVKDSSDNRKEKEKKTNPSSATELYKKLQFYSRFVILDKPLIITEGKTDYMYLKYALESLAPMFPDLAEFDGSSVRHRFQFFRYTERTRAVLGLGGGTGDIQNLCTYYTSYLKKFSHAPMQHPVILLVDNDDGVTRLFNVIKDIFKISITHASDEAFFRLHANLYLVKTKQNTKDHKSCIEDYFEKSVRDTKIAGKSFDPSNEGDTSKTYGKYIFADQVVRRNKKSIDFTEFGEVFSRISAVLADYYVRRAAARAVA